MGIFDNLPKLMLEENRREFNKREEKDELTHEDLDDWIDALKWLGDLLGSQKFQDFKNDQKA